MKSGLIALALLMVAPLPALAAGPSGPQIDAAMRAAMKQTGAQGLAVAVIEDGRPAYVQSYGYRNARGEELQPETIMYGASLTKAVFAYTVLQMADEGIIDLDAPISRYLKKPLPEYAGFDRAYAPWNTLTDERWRKITPRMLLTHSGGFANFYWLNPGEKVVIHFDPGSRYAYSGDGMILLQFVLEQGLGLNLGQEMQRRVFDRFGMKNTSMIWRPDFARNLADGWGADGRTEPHDERSKVRAAGSMDTTIADFAKFSTAMINGVGLSPASRAEMTRAILPIATASQFPSFQPELPVDQRRKDLAAGLGVVVFDGPQGHGFFKGGHNDFTANTWVCIEARKACVVLLSNGVRAETAFPGLVTFILGETGVPYDWEYGSPAAKAP